VVQLGYPVHGEKIFLRPYQQNLQNLKWNSDTKARGVCVWVGLELHLLWQMRRVFRVWWFRLFASVTRD